MKAVVPPVTDYASVIVSDQPVLVQHTRLDSRQAALALLSTIAYSQWPPQPASPVSDPFA